LPHAVADYIQQAHHNANLARYLRQNKTDCLDWALTCLFYSAVHWVNAYLCKCGKPIPRRHTSIESGKPGRLNIVQQDSTLRKIYVSYRTLDDESRDARYELQIPLPAEYDRSLLPELEKVKAFIEPQVTT
jgi:hypothetical protein